MVKITEEKMKNENNIMAVVLAVIFLVVIIGVGYYALNREIINEEMICLEEIAIDYCNTHKMIFLVNSINKNPVFLEENYPYFRCIIIHSRDERKLERETERFNFYDYEIKECEEER